MVLLLIKWVADPTVPLTLYNTDPDTSSSNNFGSDPDPEVQNAAYLKKSNSLRFFYPFY
jgi:hypothetical protein